MTPTPRELRLEERMALRLFVLFGIAAVVYWGFRIGTSDFGEPRQAAVVGHDAPWRKVTNKRHVVAIGTDRRTNDIVLYDRKASTSHILLERRGGANRWWAVLHNRSIDREITIHRGTNLGGKAPKSGPSRVQVNRYKLKDGDRFLVPVFTQKGKPKQPKDSCSPTAVLRWLRMHQKAEKTDKFTQKNLLSLIIQQTRQPFRISNQQGRMHWGTGQSKRILWLDESQKYQLPASAGAGTLEYRYGRWQKWQRDRWQPLSGILRWGKPEKQVQVVNRPHISFSPSYQIGLTSSPCRWPLHPKAIPAGIELGGIARLAFTRGRLTLQHIGQHPTPLQIVPKQGSPRLLGTATVFSGDLLTLGQLTYRITIGKDRIRLMLARRPQKYLFPFFNDFPSENLPMRKLLPTSGSLMLTGGEGSDEQSEHSERWRIALSLLGVPGSTQIKAPYRPFLLIKQNKEKHLSIKPLGEANIYPSKPNGKLLTKRITGITKLKTERNLFYVKRLYIRVFSPSYFGLAWRIALLWMLVVGGALFFLGKWILSGRIPLYPHPTPLPLTHPPLSLDRPPPTTTPDPEQPLWRWLPFLLLFPLALFLNGLGLYVLSALSLSSLGLNNHSFLYRQLLWSLVGIIAFVGILGWSKEGTQRLWERMQSWSFLGGVFRWFQKLRPEKIQGVQVMGVDTAPRFSWKGFGLLSTFILALSCSIALLFHSIALIFPFLLMYSYGLLLRWEWRRSHYHTERRKSLKYFFLTLILLGLVPVIGLLIPPLVHNRFFLKVPGVGTIKLSEFAIIAAILFFASFLGLELFALRKIKSRNQQKERDTKQKEQAAQLSDDTLPRSVETSEPKEQEALPFEEASHRIQRLERIGGALSVSFLYLLLLGAIGMLYTAQGDLGPGLILTLCFSLYLLFAFSGSGADRLTTLGNLSRIGFVLGGLFLLIWIPTLIATMFPEWVQSSAELQKIQERLSLWQQPWRFIVGEQILQNLWSLSRHNGAFQWFNNLHSDFVLTGVVGVLSPAWGYALIGISCFFPLAALSISRLYWHPLSSYDSVELTALKERDTIRSLVILFGGIYLFAQNFIHIGSVLRLTPMTGVTFTWVSSGGTSIVVCYLVLAMMYRQLR